MKSKSIPRIIPLTITGVYGTVHMESVDIDTDPPVAVTIDCETIFFDLPIKNIQYTGTITEATLHFGIQTVRVPVTPPVTTRKGDNVHVIQPLTIFDVISGGPSIPSWTSWPQDKR